MKLEPKNRLNLIYDENGANEVNRQIMDAYHSGVMDHEAGKFEWDIIDQSLE